MKKATISAHSWKLAANVVAIALTIGLVLALVPWLPRFPAGDLDSAYSWATNAAVEQGLRFGRDIIYNYGPLSSAVTQEYSNKTDLLMVTVNMLLALGCSAGALALSQGRRPLRLALLYLFVVLAPGVEIIFQVAALIYAMICLETTKRHDSSSGIRPNLLEYIALILLTAVLALMPLIKGSFLTTAFIVTPISLIILATCTRLGAILLTIEYIVVCTVGWALTGQPLIALPEFLTSQLPIVASYTDAMSSSGPIRDLVYYLISVAITVWLGYRDDTRTRGWSGKLWIVCLLTVSFAIFKLSFVRHDAHALHAAAFLPLLALVVTFKSRHSTAAWAVSIAVAGSVLIGHTYGEYTGTKWIVEQIWLRNATAMTGLKLRIEHPEALVDAYDSAVSVVQRSDLLPQTTGKADIYGTQQGLLLSYGFPWSPRPIIQSYQATSPYLAKLNRDHLLKEDAPQTIYFRLSPIDGRLPAIEDGLSWPTLLTHYRVETYTGHFLVMKRLTEPLPSTARLVMQKEVPVGVPVEIPHTDGITWAEINLEPTLLGRLISVLYKLPELQIIESMPDGTNISYRYIASMASAGFILSPLVRSTPEFALLVSSSKSAYFSNLTPKSFDISGTTGTRWLWSRTMKVKLYDRELPTQANPEFTLFSKPVDVKDARNIVSAPSGGDCSIDEINGVLPGNGVIRSGDLVQVSGWAMLSAKTGVTADKIFAILSDNSGHAVVIAAATFDRPDVASYFNVPDVGKSGFSALFNAHDLHGEYTLSIVSKRGQQTEKCPILKKILLTNEHRQI